MKQTVKRIVIFMSIIIIIIAIISCSSNNIDSSEIIGQWTTIEGNDFRFLEFFSDVTKLNRKAYGTAKMLLIITLQAQSAE